MIGSAHPSPPEGYHAWTGPGFHAWALPEAQAWMAAALERHGSLYEGARREAGREALEGGRAPVYVVRVGTSAWAVRHYVRGGAAAPWLGDRYLRGAAPRPFLETTVSGRLRGLGIATPQVVAAAIYPRGAIQRGDIVTEFLPNARDLAHFLFLGPAPEPEALLSRGLALEGAGAVVRKLAASAVRHPDLNARNLLVTTDGNRPEIHLLDLDRCRSRGRLPLAAGTLMMRRLRKSLRGWEERSGRPLADSEWNALERGFAEGTGPGGSTSTRQGEGGTART